MVEISVALAEALLLEKEGTALRKRHQQQQRRAAGRQGQDKAASGSPVSSMPPGTTAATAVAPAASAAEAGAAGSADAEMVHQCWNDEKAAENKRRVDILSKSLEASDIHDLQVLRRSLQRQVDDAARGLRSKPGRRSRSERSPAGRPPEQQRGAPAAASLEVRNVALDEDERWRADVLGQRLELVERAVEKKGGWRSAVFLDDNRNGGGGGGGDQVNVDVDVEAWPAADAVLMLQTVKDALNVQLLEVSCRMQMPR